MTIDFDSTQKMVQTWTQWSLSSGQSDADVVYKHANWYNTYNLIAKVAFPGVFVAFFCLIVLWSYNCENFWSMAWHISPMSSGCSAAESLWFMIGIGLMFALAPIWLIAILWVIWLNVTNKYLKILTSLPLIVFFWIEFFVLLQLLVEAVL